MTTRNSWYHTHLFVSAIAIFLISRVLMPPPSDSTHKFSVSVSTIFCLRTIGLYRVGRLKTYKQISWNGMASVKKVVIKTCLFYKSGTRNDMTHSICTACCLKSVQHATWVQLEHPAYCCIFAFSNCKVNLYYIFHTSLYKLGDYSLVFDI